jgi:hypothetical protein
MVFQSPFLTVAIGCAGKGFRHAIIAVIAALMAVPAMATDIPAPRHEYWAPVPMPLSVKGTTPTVPSYSPEVLKVLDQTAKEIVNALSNNLPGAPMSGLNYYNTVVGQSMGRKTIKSTAESASFLDKAMKGLVTDTSEVSKAIKGMTDFGTAKVEMITEWLDNIHPHIFMKAEMAENAQRVFEMYKALRSVQMMMHAWKQNGPLIKIDLLDITPDLEVQSDYPRDPSVRLKLTYKDFEYPHNIYAAMGVDNPFIGKWDSPRVVYKGPRSFSDLSIKVEASPYIQKDGTDPSVNNATTEMEGLNKVLDRYFFEGSMGGAAAKMGIRFDLKGNVINRPSPILLQARATEVSQNRIAQIQREKSALAQLGVPPDKISEKYDAEENFWVNWPTNLKESQSARINRIRGELQTVNGETAKAEAAPKMANEDNKMDKGSTGLSWMDNLYNTYKSIGQAVTDVVSAVTDKEDPETSGPRMVWKANVQYTLSTFDAYHEAEALRKIIYSRTKASMQNEESNAFTEMKQRADKRLAQVGDTDAQVADFLDKGQRLFDMFIEMGFDDPQGTIQEITDEIAARRRQQ